MKKFNFKTMLLLVLASCVFGVVVNVTTSLGPQTAITAQASKKLSQASKLLRSTPSFRRLTALPKIGSPIVNLDTVIRLVMAAATVAINCCAHTYTATCHPSIRKNVLIPTSPRATVPGSRPNGSGNIITGTNPIFLLDHTKKTTNY